MHNFVRALRIAFAHRVNMVGCVLTSLVIALLWGGSLTAVFWVVDVVMNDQSVPDWVEQKIAESEREVADDDRWLAQLSEIAASEPDKAQQRLLAEIDHRKEELANHKKQSAHT